jgi:citrate lyase synthetase
MRDAGRVADVQIEEFLEDDFVELAVLREDERIVQTRDEEDVVDAETGEIRKARRSQTSPWSIIASATFRNPAMFAPLT